MRLIDVDPVMEELERSQFDTYHDYSMTFDTLDLAPTIEAEPVKHGRWIFHRDEDGWHIWYECSLCHKTSQKDTPYCGNCGAIMDGVTE